jgi:hypothetical protein
MDNAHFHLMTSLRGCFGSAVGYENPIMMDMPKDAAYTNCQSTLPSAGPPGKEMI